MSDERIYRAEITSYAVWAGLSGVPLYVQIFFCIDLGWKTVLLAHKGWENLAIAVAFPLLTTIWLSRYRLFLSSSEISYRSWRGSWSSPFTQLESIIPSRVTPISKIPIGAYVTFKDGRRELVYCKVFSADAIKDLFHVLAAV